MRAIRWTCLLGGEVTDRESDESRWALWMTQAQRGDEAAYVRLLTEIAEVIKAYLLTRFGRVEMLDDCVQESLIAIHQARHTYDGSRPIRPWLFTIVRHKAVDMFRRQRSQRRFDEHSEIDGYEHDPALLQDTNRLLGALSADHREAIVLTKFWGFSIRECATQLGVSESVVKVRVHRGIKKIRATLESEPT